MSRQSTSEVEHRRLPGRALLRARVPAYGGSNRSWVVPGMRLSLFGLVAVLSLVNNGGAEAALWLLALGAVAGLATWRERDDRTTRLLIVAEAGVAALGGVLTGGSTSPLLAYLPASTLAAGVALGVDAAVITTLAITAVLLVGRAQLVATDSIGRFTTVASQWTALSLATGVLGALLRNVLRDPPDSASRERYAEAYRLLAQLRGVTRRLPGSLDPASVATELIAHCRTVATFNRAAVFVQTEGSVLVPLALEGARRVPWRVDIREPGPIATAWETLSPVIERRPADLTGRRKGSHLVALPIVVDDRPIGVTVLETLGETPLDRDIIALLQPIVAASGLPLETAALFDELRTSAASEERQRLAKEIHDGIAQDLAYIGFELDGLLSELRDTGEGGAAEHARELRQRITALISELRSSISDLRSSVAPTRGLGSALSEYARAVGTSSDVIVHLSLAEGPLRLASDAELQLLRIAHEAIGSARRRTGVRNLWVTLAVEPPAASLLIEDDGSESHPAQVDPLVLEVMRERADHLRARLEVTRRRPQGISVRVEVGRNGDADSSVS